MKLAAFSRSCSHRGIAPMAVTTSTLETFIDEVDRTSLDRSPVKLRRVISWNWNKCVDEVATWPRLKLDMVPARVPWTLPWSAFTPEFRCDVDKCLARLAGVDLAEEDELDEDRELDEDGPDKPLRPGTLKWRRFQLRMAASALVATGVAVTEIKNIADVVKPGPYRQVINNLKARYGGKTAHLYGLATALKTIAKYHCKVTEAELKVLSRICKRNLVRQRGMTLKNRNRLRPFTDPATRDELLLLPQKVMREASKKAEPDRKAALAAQMAVALEIECMAPLRAANLAMLEIGRHLVFVGNGRDEHAVITLPEEEVKNEITLEYPLSSESTRLIKRYIDKFLPLLGQPGGTHLFPSPRGGAKKPNTLSLQVAAVVQKATGHRIHLHLLRHFAAMVYLQKHPGAYAAVQRLLGHATASAAINAYVGLETAAAARQYDEIVLGHRRAAETAPAGVDVAAWTAVMTGADHQPVRCLKLAEWPDEDRLAWAKAIGDDDQLEEPGLFADLRPATISMLESAYGRWLWSRHVQGALSPDASPASRITRKAVAGYLAELRARNAPLTVAHRVLRLERVARAFAPDADWRWLRRLVNRLFVRAKPVRDKRARMRPASEVFAAGLQMMAEAEAGSFTSSKKQALAFRDGLLIALLAARALRAANLASMEIDRHLRCLGDLWLLVFEGGETKNGDPLELPLPEELHQPLERYLAHWRPVLLGRSVSTRLWISAYGRPIRPDNLHFIVTRTTKKRLGVSINPHLLRSCLATETAIRDPDGAGLATPMLGHRVGATTDKHYNLAQQHEAARQWQQHVRELRRAARQRSRE